MSESTRNTASAGSTGFNAVSLRSSTVPSEVITPTIALGSMRTPLFAKTEYAEAISIGEISNAPSAIDG